MLRVISQTLFGLVLLAAGFYFGFVFLQGLADNSASWAIFCAIPLIIASIFLLALAGKSDATVFKKTKIPQLGENQDSATDGFANQLKKNNQMLSDWSKTNLAKDRLHMMEISAEAGNEN